MAADGRQFHAYAADVADYDSCHTCVEKIGAEVGPVNILVNNAGITRDASFKKLDKVNWDAVIRTNLDSAWFETGCFCVTGTSGISPRFWQRKRISRGTASRGGCRERSGLQRLKWPESEQRQPVFVRLAAHQFPGTPARTFGASATHETPMAEGKLQQAEPGASTFQMSPVRQADTNARVEVLDHRAAAWRALHGVGHGGMDALKLAAHAGKQMVAALPERARRFGLAMQQTARAYEFGRHLVSSRDRLEVRIQHTGESEQIVSLILQRASQDANT